MIRESVDVRPLIKDSPLRLGLLQEERPGIIVADTSEITRGIGAADTSEMIIAKTSPTRPARERIFEYCQCMITVQP